MIGGGITGRPRPSIPGRRGVKRDTAALGVMGIPLGDMVAGIRFCGFCMGLPAAAAKGAVTAVTEAGRGCGGVARVVGVTTGGPPS